MRCWGHAVWGAGGDQHLEAQEVLFCEIDGRVLGGMQLGGMQFGVLVALFCESDGRVLGGMQFGVPVEERLCESDGRVLHAAWGAGGGAVLRDLGGMQIGVLVEVLFCDIAIDGRVLGDSLVLAPVLRWGAVGCCTAGCCLG